MFKQVEKIIAPNKKPCAVFNPYDPRAPEVAEHLKTRVEQHMAEVVIEHIGSTSIPDCPGKGIIDLMALYPDNHLGTVVALLSSMGFQRQGEEYRNRYPDERPGMTGILNYEDTPYLVYIHIIHKESHEAGRFRMFRDRLKEDSHLLNQYIAEKKRIIATGVTDTDDYGEMKHHIVKRILCEYYEGDRS